MNRSPHPRRWLPALVLLLAAAFALRVRHLGAADLTFDEVATVFVARRGLGEVVRYVMGAAREHPPVYYLLMSLWMRAAGATEFAVRYPSALIGVVTVAWGCRLGRRLSGRWGGLWSAALFALAPFSVWAGRTGRMYGLVVLLALMTMDAWLRWLRRPGWRRWLAFTALSAVGAMTHYYLVLLWPAQALLLLLLPRTTRPIRGAWLATAAGVGALVSAFVVASPGVRAMLLETGRRFPVWGFRAEEFGVLFADIYLQGFRPELIGAGIVALALTAAGWALGWRDRAWAGALPAVWALAPLALLNFVPERMETRYLAPIFPALVFGLASLIRHLRFRPLQGIALAGVVAVAGWRLPLLTAHPDTTFSRRVEVLHAAGAPGDGLVMNGPWPGLLLTYYEPPDFLEIHSVPVTAPPGYDAAEDVPRLEIIFDRHDRVWVSYGAIHWADPEYSVSRWLAEHAYNVYEDAGLVLYTPPPEALEVRRADVALGPETRLRAAAVDRSTAQIGDTVRVRLELEGAGIAPTTGVSLALLDDTGAVWQRYDGNLGPVHHLADAELPRRWEEHRGLLVLPGTPPGTYTLAVRFEGTGLDPEGADGQGWLALGPLEIVPGAAAADLTRILPHHGDVTTTFGSELRVVGVAPYGDRFMQGYPAGFDVWWEALAPLTAARVRVRLAGPERVEVGEFALGRERTPAAAWQPGDVVRQPISVALPDDLDAGSYRVQVQVTTAAGDPLPVAGREAWAELFSFTVEARARHWRPPLARTRRDIRFGDALRLRGYRLERTEARAGETVGYTVYWQAQREMETIYAAFNHLRAAGQPNPWQGDSWPQAGLYTTDRWREGEVVAESYTITLPDDVPPGDYTLYTGVYVPATGARLPAVPARGARFVNDEVPLFTLQVVE